VLVAGAAAGATGEDLVRAALSRTHGASRTSLVQRSTNLTCRRDRLAEGRILG
jgi:hypothetical protein